MAWLNSACSSNKNEDMKNEVEEFDYVVEQFADCRVLRYRVPGFDSLSLKQKELIYYLSEAALCGRDILFDQHYKHNLTIRRCLENVYQSYSGDTSTEEYKNFLIYLKRVWFSNGIHHHYSTEKFMPGFSKDYLLLLIDHSDLKMLPLLKNESIDSFKLRITEYIFNPELDKKRVLQDADADVVKNSANNFYEGVSQSEVEQFYKTVKNEADTSPISYGLNSKLIKENGVINEKVWKLNGMYSPAIEKIIFWLKKAVVVAENEQQKNVIESLIKYYESGDLETFDKYSILWVQDVNSHIDFINGFIEVYGDPLAMRATWESVVNFKNIEATRRTEIISKNAQWFEDHSPVDTRFKKTEVKGVTAKVITVAQLGGDCYPTTPIGINLPNSDWVRKNYGSKSVSIQNITEAYEKASLSSGFLEEFAADSIEIDLIRKHGGLAGNLHTDLHECLGHGSGQLLPGVSSHALKSFHSPLEEARADLFALYYIMDNKMIDLGIIDKLDVAKAEYTSYIRNGLLTQLVRIELGKNVEQAHMRNRQLVSKWCYEKGKAENVIEVFKRENKTFVKVNDFEKLRILFGQLLAEVQRIKSEGDYNAGKALVEKYGIEIDYDLHSEILTRYKALNLAPYNGFINPEFVPVIENGKIKDIQVIYPNDYIKQMIKYSEKYSFLPNYN